jgi:SAM-dependent methyltransferase
MTRFMLLDRGEELTDATVDDLRAASGPVRLRLLESSPPFREGQIVHVRPLAGSEPGRRGIVLARGAGGYSLRFQDSTRPAGDEVLGRVVAIDRGPASVSLERGVWSRLPVRWIARAVDALEVLGRLRHPLTPPLFVGQADACLGAVRAKYDRAAEVRAYSRTASTGLDERERAVVRRYVPMGGRLLDVGCGAGREALAFAREGFRVTGIDIAPAMIEAARENAAEAGLAIKFRVQSVTELDDPPGSFDGAYLPVSLQHVPGHRRRVDALRRIGRALSPDGVLILWVQYRGPRSFFSRSRLVDALRTVAVRLPGPWRVSEPGDGYMREVSEASDPRTAIFFHRYAGPGEVASEVGGAGFSAEQVAEGWWVCRPA